MSRTVSASFKQAAFAQQTGDAILELVTIESGYLASPLRVVNNGADVVSNGNTFLASRFGLSLPSSGDDQPPKARLQICNVDRLIVEAIRSIPEAPTVTIEIVMASSLDTVEVSLGDLTFSDITYDAGTIEGALSYEKVLEEPFPGDTFAPHAFPGLFGTVASP